MRSASSSGLGLGVGVAGGPTLAATQQGQGVAALLVMLAVLCFIFAYCCWGGPFIRSLCRRHCCCHLEDDENESRFGSSEQTIGTAPTIILLPHGRMLVVDGTIFTQFQADTTGLDLVELGENVLRAQRSPRCLHRHQLQNSEGSILEMDVETPSKDSLGSIGGFPPPAYESIYGKDEDDMPPSYSDILLHSKDDIEMHSLESCPHIINNPINGIPYHPYATITSYPSQSYPRRNLTRNSSLINNQIGDYYIDNEIGRVYAITSNNITNNNRTRSDELQLNSNYNINNNSHNVITRLSLNELGINDRILNNDNQRIRVVDATINRSINEIINADDVRDRRHLQFHQAIERNAHDDDGDVVDAVVGATGDVVDDDIGGRISRQAMRQDDNDDNDFGALADIRESRV
ncbi:uncharacterized protein LOC122860319 isoform X2 [Aphidius gifuensis]|uniref:uncharacterized protein LOC122860319 isoform X2 n=1 Tax=Aphidius gifuensis TaxID=684658 RepID=UPI001CDB8978|nr:uncharacterized protein LOC122860319 isoform X2 [Aphidius gifuensis]